MRRLLVAGALLGLVVMATPAMAETAGDTAHITGNVPASITFTFTTPASVNVGPLPANASANADFGYEVSSNASWRIDLTPTIPTGFAVNGRWLTPIPDGGPGVDFVSGTTHTGWRTNGPGTNAYSDRFTTTNMGASPGSFDISLAYLATTL